MSMVTIEPSALPERCSFEVAAVFLGVSYPAVRSWVKQGRVPKPRRLGRLVFFHRDDLLKIAEAFAKGETAA